MRPLALIAVFVMMPAVSAAGPALTFDVRPHLTGPQCGYLAPGALSCSDYVTHGGTGAGYDVYVMVGGADPGLGIAGASFGITYDGGEHSGVDILDWTACAGLDLERGDWPAPGSGITLVASGGDCLGGATAVMGSFYVYAYGEDTLAFAPLPDHGETSVQVATCTGGVVIVPADRRGEAGFGAAATGFNPCCDDVPCGPSDVTPPGLADVHGVAGDSTTTLAFSEPLRSGAINPLNYTVLLPADPEAAPAVQSVAFTGVTATLALDRALRGDARYMVSVENVKDFAGNVIPIGTEGELELAWLTLTGASRGYSLSRVDVRFDRTPGAGASDAANYHLSAAADSESVVDVQTASPEGSTVRLTLASSLTPDTDYRLRVSGVRDVAGNLIAPGSEAVFSSRGETVGPAHPVIALHVKAHASKLQCTTNSPVSIPCASYVVDAAVHEPYDLYLVLADPDPAAGFRSARFGLDYNDALEQGVDIYAWTLCAGEEHPSTGWPGRYSGNEISWGGDCASGGQTFGVQQILGWFYLSAYGADRFTLVGHPGETEPRVVDCAGSEHALFTGTDLPWDVGRVEFGARDFGHNPCGTVAVERTSWGAIKRTYGTKESP